MPEAGATDFLHTKKAGIWQRLTRRDLRGDSMLTQQGHPWSQKYLGTARGLGSQASLSVLYIEGTLPIAKGGWAAGGSPGWKHQTRS